jgi:hypothetical protein
MTIAFPVSVQSRKARNPSCRHLKEGAVALETNAFVTN